MKISGQNKFFLTAATVLFLAGCASYEEVKLKADAGDPAMQYRAAKMLLEGDGVARDDSAAEQYLRKAMESENLSAACRMAERILQRKKGDESELLMNAYEIIFTHDPHQSFEEISLVLERRREYPGDVIRYVKYLNKAGFWKSAVKFKKFAFQYMDRDRCNLPGRKIQEYRKQLEGLKSPQEIAEEQRLAEERRKEEARRAEEKRRQEELLKKDPAFRFPKRSLCSSSVPIYGELVSGTSYQWFLRFMPDSKKWSTPKTLSPDAAIYGFYVNNGNQSLIFATEKPFSAADTGTAVLVEREVSLDGGLDPDTVIAKILRENPGAKHDLKKKVTRKERNIEQMAIVYCVITDYTSTIRTKDKEWRFIYTKAEYDFKVTSWGKQQLSETDISYMRSQVPHNGVQGSVLMQILDINLYKVFSDMKIRDLQLKRAAEERAAQEKKAADLNALSL